MKSNLFHFCIKLKESKFSKQIVSKLEKNGFITNVEDNGKDEIILMVFLDLNKEENIKAFLIEAEILRIEKKRPNRQTFNPETIKENESKYSPNFYNYAKHREKLPKQMLELEKYKIFEYSKKEKFITKDQSIISIFDEAEIILIENSLLNKLFHSLEEELKTHDELVEIIALHTMDKTTNTPQTLEELKKYYGGNISMYFYFVEYMQKWLLFASAIGILVYSLNYISMEDSETSPYDSLYGLFMIIWSALFMSSWGKKQKELVVGWRYDDKKFYFPHKHFDQKLEKKIDPITGLKKKFVSTRKKIVMYLKSFLITVPIIFITILILILSLNVRGYITSEYEYIYVQDLAKLSDEGEIFDKNTNKAFITTILHVIILNIINSYYSVLCEYLTEKEIHLTENGFNNSLVTKRFIFEIFNTFMDLSFIAYVKLDITALKSELLSLYTVDEFRRVLTETVIPLILKKVKRIKFIPQIDQLKYNKYENFDDFLEIVINFAYLTLFASAFPLAPILTYVFHYVELQSDKFKINNCYQRAIPQRTKGIGAWYNVMNIVSIVAVYSNIILFAFSSSQIVEVFPWFFRHLTSFQGHFHPDEDTVVAKGMGRYLIAIIFGIEHVILIMIVIIRFLVKKRESWVDVFNKRKDYRSRIQKYRKIEGIELNKV